MLGIRTRANRPIPGRTGRACDEITFMTNKGVFSEFKVLHIKISGLKFAWIVTYFEGVPTAIFLLPESYTLFVRGRKRVSEVARIE